MRATQGAPEFGLAVGELLVAARRLLRADYAEILLLSPVAGEEALRSVSGQDGERLMQRVTVGAVDERAIGSIAASPQPILLPRRRSGHPLDGFLRARGLRRCDRVRPYGRAADLRRLAGGRPGRRRQHVRPGRRRAPGDVRESRERAARERPSRAFARPGHGAQGRAPSSGLHGRADPATEPAPVHGATRGDPRRGTGGARVPRRPVPRPRPFQGRERQLGSRRRRRAADPGGGSDPRRRATAGHGRAPRRRRVRRARAPDRCGRRAPSGPAPDRGDQRADLAVLRPTGRRARERRRRGDGPRREHARGAPAQRRPRDVHGQERGPAVRAVRAGSAPPDPSSPIARARAGACG